MACLISTIILGSQNVIGRRGRVSLILSEKIKLRVVWGECLLKVMLFCRMNLKWNWNLLKHSPLSSFNSFWVRRQVLMEHKVPPQTQSNFIIDIFAYTHSVNAKFRNQPLDHVKKNFKVFNRYPTAMPDNCQFWYTTALFRPVKLRQKMHKFVRKKICDSCD